MSPEVSLKLRASIQKHEGLRKHPYVDSMGHTSIGYGRNLSTNGISEAEANIMLNDDIVNATAELYRFIPWAQDLDDVRKAVLIELSFNMGIESLLGFRKMLESIKNKDFELASKELLDSKYAIQVHARANDLAYSLETGIL